MLINHALSVFQLFRWFQKLGWCKGVKGTRAAVDKLCSEYDAEIMKWKNEIQVIKEINFK